MRRLWVTRELEAPAPRAWEVLVDPDQWPRWGPSVTAATVEGSVLRQGSRGTVTTAVGVTLPFRITTFEPGESWSWDVAGVGATDHRVERRGPNRCLVGIGVPWVAAPYLAICRLALRRLEGILEDAEH